MNKYQHALGLFLLVAFVYLMLCPYAEILSSAHGGRVLIYQSEFRKTKKLVINEGQIEPVVFLKSHAPLCLPSPFHNVRQADGVIVQHLNLITVTTVHLLL